MMSQHMCFARGKGQWEDDASELEIRKRVD